MASGAMRAVAAGATVVVAAASGVVTNIATQEPGWAWWVGLGVLVIIGVLLQVLISLLDTGNKVTASGAGAVSIGGSAREKITTRVKGSGAAGSSRTGGVSASGAGSVTVGQDAEGEISTEIEP